jgi:hypothetical protein
VQELDRGSGLDTDCALRHLATLCGSDPECREANDILALVGHGLAIFDDGPLAALHTDPKDPGTTPEVRRPSG